MTNKPTWEEKINNWRLHKNETGLDNEEYYPSIDLEKLTSFFSDVLTTKLAEQKKEMIEKIVKTPVHLKNYHGYVVTTVGREEIINLIKQD